jgi:serine/threonine protein phosphatase PrpC
MSDFDTKKIQTFFERSIFFFGYKLLIKALDWEFVNAGDVKFKYQTDLPPEKQIVTCFPDVRQVELGTGDEFLVLACDGIWYVSIWFLCILFLSSGN